MSEAEFDQDVFDECDAVGREAGKRWAARLYNSPDVEIIDHPDTKYGVDLYVLDHGALRAYIEVQIRLDWEDDSFLPPVLLEGLQLAFKKKKHFIHKIPCYMFSFKRDLSAAFISMGWDIITCPVRPRANYRQKDGKEKFFMIPYGMLAYVTEKEMREEEET